MKYLTALCLSLQHTKSCVKVFCPTDTMLLIKIDLLQIRKQTRKQK